MKDHPGAWGKKPRAQEKLENIDDLDPATKIRDLRKRFGAGLARGWDGERTLGDLLTETGFESLTEYVKEHGGR